MRIFCDSSTKEACIVFEGQEPIIISYPAPVTVNQGEYQAVILALEEAKRLKWEEVEIFTDSLLVVSQVDGMWRCRAKHLLPFRDKVRSLACDISAMIKWLPREENLAGKVLEG